MPTQQGENPQKTPASMDPNTNQGALLAAVLGNQFMPALGGNIPGFGGSSKSKDQQSRDQVRQQLQQAGIYDQDFNYTLMDGSKANLGLDGSVRNYNVDFSKPGMDKIVSYVNPFAFLVANGDTKKATDLAGQLANAFANSKDPLAEARALYEKAGITYDSAIAGINKLNVDEQTKNVYRGTIDQMGLRGVESGDGKDLVSQQNGILGQADELAKVRASTQGFLNSIKQDAAAQQASQKQALKNQVMQQKDQYRSGLLNDLLQKNSQPINFPTPKPVQQSMANGLPTSPVAAQTKQAQPDNSQFNQALSKILGR